MPVLLTYCFLSDRKLMIHLQVDSGTCSRAGLIVLKAELKSTNIDPGVGSWCVLLFEGEVEGHVYCIVHRSVGSVGKLQGV